MSVIGNSGEMTPGANAMPGQYSNPNYNKLTVGGWDHSHLQVDCPQSTKDLKVTSDGYVYYPFYVRIGSTKGRQINYYLTSSGFSQTATGGSLKLDMVKLLSGFSVPGASGSGNLYTMPSQGDYTGGSKTPFSYNTLHQEGVIWTGTTSAVNAGNYFAMATPASGYAWADKTTSTKYYYWSISAVDASSANVIFTNDPATYTGNPITQTAAVVAQVNGSGKLLTSGTDFDLIYKDNVNAGTATVTVMFKGNYSGSTQKTFTINPKALGESSIAISDVTYTGEELTPAITVKDGNKTLVEGTDYTVEYAYNTNAGEAKATITFSGNYTGTVDKTFTINKADSTLAATQSEATIDALGGLINLNEYFTGAIGATAITIEPSDPPKGWNYDKTTGIITTDGNKSTYASVTVTVKDEGDENHKNGTVSFTVNSEPKNGFYIDKDNAGLTDKTTVYAELADAVQACPMDNSESTICAVGNPKIKRYVSIYQQNITLKAEGSATIEVDKSYNDDPNGNSTVFIVGSGSSLNLSNITIDATEANNGESAINKGLMKVDGTLNAENTTFKGGSGSHGGAIYADESAEVTIESNVTFENNSVTGNGGAIYVKSGATLTFSGESATFTGNKANNGGSVWGNDGKIEITDRDGVAGTVTSNNTGVKAASPIIVNDGILNLESGSTLQNNDNFFGQAGTGFGSQYYGGGVRNEASGTLNVKDGSTITKCYAREGGAILNINKPIRYSEYDEDNLGNYYVQDNNQLAEFIGTAVLVIVGCGVAVATGCVGNDGLAATALAFGLAIVAMAYSIGNISGCHINPAVSFAMLISKKMTVKEFFAYVGSQIVGAIVGAALVGLFFGRFTNLGGNAAQTALVDAYGDGGALGVALVVEIVLTFIFVIAILGVTSKTDNKAVTGIVIGLTLTLVHLLGIRLTGTSVNPARSIGPALLQMIGGDFTAISQIWISIVGPLCGAALAAFAYNFLAKPEKN